MGAFSIGLTSSADSGSWDATRAGTVPIVGRGPKHHNITMFSFHWSNRFACTDLERITRAELPVWGVASTCLSKGMSRHLVRVAKRDALFVASRRFLFPITSLTSRLELASHYSREHEHIWRGLRGRRRLVRVDFSRKSFCSHHCVSVSCSSIHRFSCPY